MRSKKRAKHATEVSGKQCCNWSGSLIGWLVGKALKSQPVRSFDWLPAGWF
jgi:hypothetical protein